MIHRSPRRRRSPTLPPPTRSSPDQSASIQSSSTPARWRIQAVLLVVSSAAVFGFLLGAGSNRANRASAQADSNTHADPPAEPESRAEPDPQADSNSDTDSSEDSSAETPRCNEQDPQAFLIRGNWRVTRNMSEEERRERRANEARALRYRTEKYGHFPGFGEDSWNPHPPIHYARGVRVFDRPVRLNERIIPAVQCAERAIADRCGDVPYQPQRLSGIRTRNTYHNGEVSNHVFGIALDIDPQRNSCCGCVAPWPDHPLCRREVESIFERMAMPECWVRQFQRFGFYWLGDDQLRDTMHFEFLGDPDRIVASPAPRAQ